MCYVFDYDRFADALSKNETAGSGFVFLVAARGLQHFAHGGAEAGQRAVGANELLHTIRLIFPKQMPRTADVERGQHAPGNGFAVEKFFIARYGFYCVAEGVSKVEDHTQAGFTLVDADDFGLHGDGRSDDVLERDRITSEDAFAVAFEEAKEARVTDDPCFYAFEETSAQLPRRQRFKNAYIGEDSERVMEAADEVFAGGQVDSGFAADGGINLREQRGGDLDVGDSPHVDGGQEAARVADDSSSESDEQRRSVRTCRGKLGCQAFDADQPLVPLAGSQKENGWRLIFGKCCGKRFTPK